MWFIYIKNKIKPLRINMKVGVEGKLLIHADDTFISMYHSESDHFENCIDVVFAKLKKWCKANKWTLNFDKTNFRKYIANNETHSNLNVGYGN